MKKMTTLAATLLIAGMFAAPAFAAGNGEHGSGDTFLMFTKGGVMQMAMNSDPMIDDVVKSGMLIDDKSIIVMHNGKTYLVKDMKMSNGQMLFDYAKMGNNK